ncbi:MAG TPA: RasGEF domain-containing protein, partial [Candidatus Berkiella sp.]|nr:RasGEF domain-containing protein [Candidatus Berkiella sp.]
EFYNQGWSHDNRQVNSPHIMASIDISNKLAYCIQEMIVNADNVQMAARIFELFILVCAELCSTNNYLGPNLSAAFVIVGAFNTAVTGRLTKTLQTLEKDVDKKLQQLNNFAKPS